MPRLRTPDGVRDLMASKPVWWLLPTPSTYFFNKQPALQTPQAGPKLPAAPWSQRERHGLLSTSQEHMRSLEGKGPGLATIGGVIFAAALVALTTGWDESTCLARLILVLATVYAVLSLLMPLYLVGPLARNLVTASDLEKVARVKDPEEALAAEASENAMVNFSRNKRLSNSLDAARRELVYALALLVAWVVLVPWWGTLKLHHHAAASASSAALAHRHSPSGKHPAKSNPSSTKPRSQSSSATSSASTQSRSSKSIRGKSSSTSTTSTSPGK